MTSEVKPRLKPTVDLRRSDGRLLVLRADVGGEDLELEGDIDWITTFVALLDGSRGAAELEAALIAENLHADAESVGAALEELDAAGLLEDSSHDAMLSPYELERFDRQLAYFADVVPAGLSAAGAHVHLRDATVCVLGVGGLGSWAAYGLASAGVGSLRIVDGDRLELSNLNRQILYAESDLGQAKAELAAARLAAFAPRCVIDPWVERLDGPAAVAAAVVGADLVLDAADWPPHQIDRWVNDACVAAGIPFLTMSQQPPLVRVGPLYVPGLTGCYDCLEAGFREEFESYDELVASAPASSRAATFGPACGLVGAIAASEAIHYLGGLSEPQTLGRALTLDLRDLSMSWRQALRQRDCATCRDVAAQAVPAI